MCGPNVFGHSPFLKHWCKVLDVGVLGLAFWSASEFRVPEALQACVSCVGFRACLVIPAADQEQPSEELAADPPKEQSGPGIGSHEPPNPNHGPWVVC